VYIVRITRFYTYYKLKKFVNHLELC